MVGRHRWTLVMAVCSWRRWAAGRIGGRWGICRFVIGQRAFVGAWGGWARQHAFGRSALVGWAHVVVAELPKVLVVVGLISDGDGVARWALAFGQRSRGVWA